MRRGPYGRRIAVCCPICEAMFETTPGAPRVFCSRECKDASQRLPIGSVTIRRGPAGYLRAWVKVADQSWGLRARIVWESVHGPLAEGLIVHHLDGDSINDVIDNLSAISRPEHTIEHQPWKIGAEATQAALRGWETRRANVN